MKRARLTALGLSLVVISGCGGSSDFNDLQMYMDEVRTRPKGTIEPLPAFIPYEAFTYSAAALRHPFQPPVKLDLAQRQRGSKDIQPDESRVKQFLEGFNIEIGDYLGRNHGRIVEISEAAVDVVEIVPDGEGGWLERPRSLTLKERT
jgi:type IV pilus assembly protein PilP